MRCVGMACQHTWLWCVKMDEGGDFFFFPPGYYTIFFLKKNYTYSRWNSHLNDVVNMPQYSSTPRPPCADSFPGQVLFTSTVEGWQKANHDTSHWETQMKLKLMVFLPFSADTLSAVNAPSVTNLLS